MIAHVHISENDRSTPGQGAIRWAENFDALKAIGYDGWLTVEAFGLALPEIDQATQTELEAAAFRRLVAHLRNRTDVQNIDLMNLAGFCRNCLSNWLKEAADAQGVALSRDEAREAIYGMPYEAWKARQQSAATPDQLATLAGSQDTSRGH